MSAPERISVAGFNEVEIVHTSGATVLVAARKVDHLLSTGFARADEQEADGRPRGNASRDEWAAYAAVLGVEVPEDAKRADIKALVEAHPAATQDE